MADVTDRMVDAAWKAYVEARDGKPMHAAIEAALREQPAPEPVAKVELMLTGGNAGLATRIVEIDDHLRERLRPGQMLYTAPPQRKPLTDEEIDRLWRDPQQGYWDYRKFARAIERAHGIGGEK